MPPVPEARRIAELRRLGLSEPLVRLSAGELVHRAFRDSCLGPPYYVYAGARPPDGAAVAPLWDHGDEVAAAWERGGGLEFIEFSIEDPDGYRALARTEQGFWATRFDWLYECDAAVDDLRQAAAAVGFRFLDRYLSARGAAEGRLDTHEAHRAWLAELVAGIDRDAAP